MPIEFEDKSIVIDGAPTFLYSGEFEYFRVPPECWEDRLSRLKAGGLNCVGLYFAWNFHCPEADTCDFSSEARDIARLLSTVRDHGLYAIARPGPYICNEWDLGGYPGWLIAEDSGDWRSSDPKHLPWLRRWYAQVNAILSKFQHDCGGPIIAYQLENEYRWDDNTLLDKLYDYAREDGITVPLIGNHDGGAVSSGAKVTDGVDTYTGVGERYRWRGWQRAMYERIGPRTPLMVLEFRGCDMSLWGEKAPSEERLPSEWIVGQEKLFTAMGANLTNRFIAAGGLTPRPYHSDHITTEYGTRAAVSPWGAVTESKSFGPMRLWGEFIASVNRSLSVSKPWDIGWGTDNAQVECLARRSDAGIFFTLLNLSGRRQTARIRLPAELPICKHGITLEPGEIRTIVAGLDAGELRIEYCTAEIVKIASFCGRPFVVVHGPVGTDSVIGLTCRGRTAEVAVGVADEPALRTIDLGNDRIDVWSVSTDAAMRAWFLPTEDGVAPLFTNANLLLAGQTGGSARIEIESQKTLTVVAPAAVSALKIGDGAPRAGQPRNGAVEWSEVVLGSPKPKIDIGPLQARVESAWMNTLPAEGDDWRKARAYGSGAEILKNPGRVRWITSFEMPDEKATHLDLLGISSAETEVYLNGHAIGVFPQTRPAGYPFLSEFGASFDISGALRPGRNILAVAMNVPGRHNCGQPIYCGFSAPVVLSSRRLPAVDLPIWQSSPFDDRRWFVSDLDGVPPEAEPRFDRSGWESIDLTVSERHLWLRRSDVRHRVRWYCASVEIPESYAGRPMFLETSPAEEAWVYCSGELISRKLSGTSPVFDLSRFSSQRKIEIAIAVRHNWYFFNETWGLSSAPRLFSADLAVDPEWLRSDGSEGELRHWAVSDDGWSGAQTVRDAADLWVRRTVRIDRSGADFAPIYVELEDWQTHADLYWNGVPIGMYASIGPQKRFYVPDGLIREANQVALRVSGYGKPAVLGALDVGCYGARRFETVTIPRAGP